MSKSLYFFLPNFLIIFSPSHLDHDHELHYGCLQLNFNVTMSPSKCRKPLCNIHVLEFTCRDCQFHTLFHFCGNIL